MEILKTKIAIMGSALTGLPNSEIEILANSVIELSKSMSGEQTVVDG
ncbi:hypothetical protein [Acinetobacter sp. WU_MDCI_Abxb74]|nr:hypothetical protein [Acinetobacter sp. WU_MDCI_Abxb74]MCU4423342.1 hypothetical protein [Acinetobacter sp. WU_MDCI_Abxb74]